MSALKLQFIGSEIHFDGYRIGVLDESAAPPSTMDAAREFMEDGDPNEDEWVSKETHEEVKGERKDALDRAEKAEAAVTDKENALDRVVERIDGITALLTEQDEKGDPLALGLAAKVTAAVEELNKLKESLL
ncbi:hypothetical protein [Oceanibaculum indicum]|uniref:Uncharacterized protein n=1 Tax=Oceanibaculum indicum TaxID=526216 RepID=A0A420WGJ4_9PROT|nr:hypothetical protein [Oceanibaculum indicum]RKQ70144.1 hypothetical protein BCL74_2084 [Oceanibaculum indicum]